MSRCWGLRGPSAGSALLFLILAGGCSNPAGLRNDAAPADKQVPFHDQERSAPGGSTPPASSPAKNPAHDKAAKGGGPKDTSDNDPDFPFRDSQGLPAGTLLTVRLSDPVSADHPEASGRFGAVIDEPIIIEGNVLVPRGVSVEGRIESARASQLKQNRGYLRLTLDSIDLAGNEIPVQTSSLFASGTADGGGQPTLSVSAPASPAPVTLEKGRRLTFRLTEPVYLASHHAASSH